MSVVSATAGTRGYCFAITGMTVGSQLQPVVTFLPLTSTPPPSTHLGKISRREVAYEPRGVNKGLFCVDLLGSFGCDGCEGCGSYGVGTGIRGYGYGWSARVDSFPNALCDCIGVCFSFFFSLVLFCLGSVQKLNGFYWKWLRLVLGLSHAFTARGT